MVNRFSHLRKQKKKDKKGRIKEHLTQKDKKGRIKEHLTQLTYQQRLNIWILLGVCFVLCLVSGMFAYYTTPFTLNQVGQPPSSGMKATRRIGVGEFFGFNHRLFSPNVLVGLVSGVVFGFIDNGGLYFGMDALDPILPGDNLEKAGWGNTFSDGLGAFLATFIGKIVQNKSGVEDTPLWTDFVGIIIGCVFGIYIPKAIKQLMGGN
jgi:hypothetical protein